VIDGNPAVLSSADERAQLEETLGIVLLDRGRFEEADVRFQALQQLCETEGSPSGRLPDRQ
jgi:Flp pilus assembly protein TadD